MQKYKLDKTTLSQLEEPQLRLFESEFEKVTKNNINIEYKHKSYNVNNIEVENKSKISSICFFSGAGGLDIGSQLAGVKVISSMDFDKDSVATLKSNNYFKDTVHFHKDIEEMKTSDYSDVLSGNEKEKLILLGGPPCQPFSKAGYWKKHENRLGSEDPRNMIGQYLRMIEEMKPDGFVLENVESLLHPKNVEAVQKLEEAIKKMDLKRNEN
jgi:DNA (cytosine-5)-methyltransferase 1